MSDHKTTQPLEKVVLGILVAITTILILDMAMTHTSADSFYVILASNVSDPIRANKLSEYTISLPTTLDLDSSYMVGMVEVSFTNRYYTLSKTNRIGFIKESYITPNTSAGSRVEILAENLWTNTITEFEVTPTSYSDITDLLQDINTVMDEMSKKIAGKGGVTPPKIMNNFKEEKVLVATGLLGKEKLYAIFDPELATILGIAMDERVSSYKEYLKEVMRNMQYMIYHDQERNLIGMRPTKDMIIGKLYGTMGVSCYDIDSVTRLMYIYSDVAAPSFVGDSMSPLLRIVEVSKTKPGGQTTLSFDNIQYRHVAKSKFREITINIRTDSGNLFPFIYGRTVVTLHFVKSK